MTTTFVATQLSTRTKKISQTPQIECVCVFFIVRDCTSECFAILLNTDTFRESVLTFKGYPWLIVRPTLYDQLLSRGLAVAW